MFGPLTLVESLAIRGLARDKNSGVLDRVLALFPLLRERLTQLSSTLWGGEQQMLTVARAPCMEPRVLLRDEPTDGLQPAAIALIREVPLVLKSSGVAVVLVGQRVDTVLKLADRVAFMALGRIEETMLVSGLRSDDQAFKTYVGV